MTRGAVDLKDVWASSKSEFAQAMKAGAGFSFFYDGKAVGPEFSEEWTITSEDTAEPGVSETIFAHSSGLQVTRITRLLSAFNAVEYTLQFKNTAAVRLTPISALHTLNLSFGDGIQHGNAVISSGGGLADGFLPPRSFALRTQRFAPTVRDWGIVELSSNGGRSSNGDMPFFFVQNEVLNEGAYFAIGWSGQWEAMVQRTTTAASLLVRAKIPELNIALEPGEEIPGPTILVGLYDGDCAEGSNCMRRLMRDVYTPKLNGETFLPIATYDTFFGLGDQIDEALLKQVADGAAEVGQEYFLVDAGWFGDKGWFTSLGNWGVNKTKLPNGLEPVADYVRAKGMKFGLWFEPERVAAGSELAQARPQWVLWEHGEGVEPWFAHVPWTSDFKPDDKSELFNTKFGLLNLGLAEVQDWVVDLIDGYIRKCDIRYIRYDFNLEPLPYWRANDAADRRGITQLRYIEGFYAIIDRIRANHPKTVLEGCASGGRRIDLETVRRFHCCWISDYTGDPSIVRFHLSGINHFLPGSHHYVQYTLPLAHQKDFEADDMGFQSMFAGSFGVGGHVEQWPEAQKQKAILHNKTWKALRHYLVEDYFAIGGQGGDLESWTGWQFNDPKAQSGFVQIFRTDAQRRNGRSAKYKCVLRGLDEAARYELTDPYSSKSFVISGAQAMTEGFETEQAPMTAAILTYRNIGDVS